MRLTHQDLEYPLPVSRGYVEGLIERLSKSPATGENGESFAVHTLDLHDAISFLRQAAEQLDR